MGVCDVCGGESLELVLARYQQMVDEYGWVVIAVEEDGPGRPAYAYTVGLHAGHGHPELLVSGRPDRSGSVGVLNQLAAYVRGGSPLDGTAPLPRHLVHPVGVVEVADPRRLEVAQALQGGDDVLVPALQVVWPDVRGRWPWERGWSESGREFFGHSAPSCLPSWIGGVLRSPEGARRRRPSRS